MYILGIETSCDETAAAVVDISGQILSNIVASQIALHKPYGGIVPEVASRAHLENITRVVEEALKQADLDWKHINAIAATQGPGLIGALLVGWNFAKALAYSLKVPFFPINHLAGHLLTPLFSTPEAQLPYLGLLVSGGHTALYLVEDIGNYTLLGETLDDAVGECFDKVAKYLGLGYPGGPIIEKTAAQNKNQYTESFPRPCLNRDDFMFSFSGLKTAVAVALANKVKQKQHIDIPNIAAAFQAAAVEVLVTKTIKAAEKFNIKNISICGGVAANKALRAAMLEGCKSNNYNLFVPPFYLCTDNAAMIALAASKYAKGLVEDEYLHLNAYPNLPLTSNIIHPD